MAKIRIGFSTHFEVENELVGIGTDNPTNTKQVLGNIKSSDAKVIGITTLTTFDGFTDTKLSLQGSAGAKQHTTSGQIIIEGNVIVKTINGSVEINESLELSFETFKRGLEIRFPNPLILENNPQVDWESI